LHHVEPLFEILTARIRDDASSAERPRAELHRALKPAHDLAAREQIGGLGPDVAEPLKGHAHALERAGDRLVGPGRAEVGVAEIDAREFAGQLAVTDER